MNTTEALGIFIGLPLLLGIIVAALVYSKSWTRNGRAGADYDSNPLLFASAPARPDPSRIPSGRVAPVVGGGVSARW